MLHVKGQDPNIQHVTLAPKKRLCLPRGNAGRAQGTGQAEENLDHDFLRWLSSVWPVFHLIVKGSGC